jgi:deoxyribonuclease V
MLHRGEVIGAALRTKNKVNPVYVSPGNLIDLETSVSLMLQCNGGYRIPEPTRRAHNLVNTVRRAHLA